MVSSIMSRRDYLRVVGTGTALAASGMGVGCTKESGKTGGQSEAPPPPTAAEVADRARRMQWWHQAKFGMFIHWGLYSVLGRRVWAMDKEGIPVAEWEQLAKQFVPKPQPARTWAKLARHAGQKYMVMCTKQHDGFCLFDTRLTNYCAPKQACGRDLVHEYVEAARAEGLRVGFYYSLMDWHHPDGARCAADEAARQRFVAYTHGQIRELMTNYGKIDILWYDVAWPLDAKGWESEKMNRMVFSLQPDIIVNNRNKLPGDFSTPEQQIVAEKGGRAWESCMTMNDSWGYHKADDAWKSPKTIVRNLITCAGSGGNYLLNIGPRPDGSVPEESVRILTVVGKWMERNGPAIYEAEFIEGETHTYLNYTRTGNTLYVHVHFWPGQAVAIGGLRAKVKAARLFASGQKVDFHQDEIRLSLTGLPEKAPDDPVTVIAVECESEPRIDPTFVRRERKRGHA
jgi:alpha-L-fucosidase